MVKMIFAVVLTAFCMFGVAKAESYPAPTEFLQTENLSTEYQERLVLAVHNAVEEYGHGEVDEYDIWSVLYQESRFNHFGKGGGGSRDSEEGKVKRGASGEYGACQLMKMWRNNKVVQATYEEGYGQQLNPFDLQKLEDNVACCVTVLVYYVRKNKKKRDMFGHYNGGPHNNTKYGNTVLNRAEKYREEGSEMAIISAEE